MNDTALYDEFADSWWDPDGFLHGIGTLLNPVRLPYIDRVLPDHGPPDRRVLDIGCGGGLLAEPLGELGMVVTGVDASIPSLAAGRDHGDTVRYVGASADRLPFLDGTFDIVVAMEVLEHVEDPVSVVVEATRVLRPGGTFFFAGPSRTRLSRWMLIDLAQRWRWSAVLPRDLHRWERFITPSEMSMMLQDSGIVTQETIGLGLDWGGLLAAMRAYRLLRRGRIGHAEAGRRVRLTTRRSTKIAYMGYGTKG
ncbi:MAG: bifunctional 2-polyprenyl-6-hydroxyphenol methylase/3-demethylubiquinol 3-O-methyltransferase UbiG [Acidimicrobiia bacterium]